MKQSYSQKHPYWSVILIGLLCTFLTALGSAVPQIIGLEPYVQRAVTTAFLLVSIILGIIIMKKSGRSFAEYGFRKTEKASIRKVWWYIPLILIEIIPIAVAGLEDGITALQYIIMLLFTVAVGFNEEIYFRGLAFQVISVKGRKNAIIWTSMVFGILHLFNALSGKNTLDLILQMLFAFLVGFVLAEVVSITKSLWALIIWHAAHDYISGITGDSLDKTALIILAVQVGVLLIYAICIWKASRHDE